MASIVPVVTTINGGLLKLGSGSTTYEQAVTSFEVNPTTPVTKVKTVAGGPFIGVGTAEYDAVITALQDPKTTGSLFNYLVTNAGTTVTFLWTQAPGTTGAVTISGSLVALAPNFGGAVDKDLEFTLTLPVVGAPVYGTAA
jgi:hypothetical protein